MPLARAGRAALPVTLLAAVLAACGPPAAEPAASGPTTRPTSSADRSEAAPDVASEPTPEVSPDVSAELGALEQEFDARVGASALDTGTGRLVEHRADERFGFASTIKVFAAAVLLRQVPSDERGTRVTWTQHEVDEAGYSPVTSDHVQDGLTLAELAEAAVRESDNAATNLVLGRIGGPAGLDAGLARLGDSTTEVVHDEPALNSVDPASSADDTTTPAAFTASLAAVLGPGTLAPDDRALLLDWMSGNATGDALVRAGAPQGWVVADKSGGAGGMRNDIAVVVPPGRDPIIITVLTAKNDPAAGYDDELVARTAQVVLAAFA
ncbi:class A beta-lactamase [Cellulosimicrobium terreum]|nr:class A beta-lactamase [Cellulosimicrobium terreum]